MRVRIIYNVINNIVVTNWYSLFINEY